jgi:hypothetical protein
MPLVRETADARLAMNWCGSCIRDSLDLRATRGGVLGASDGFGPGPVRANGAGMIAAGDGVRLGHGDPMAHRPAPATGDVLN